MIGVKLPSVGFTVVETMIFLAVTSALLLVAMVAISGQQSQAQYQDSARSFQTAFDSVIADVAKTQYPAPKEQCRVFGNGAPSLSPGSTDQGTNSDCIFLGKVVQFTANSTSLRVITVVGRRLTPTGDYVNSFAEAKPVPVYSSDESIDLKQLTPNRLDWSPLYPDCTRPGGSPTPESPFCSSQVPPLSLN